jgi:hypothetical protein
MSLISHRTTALYHFDQLPIDPIKIVCLQEKWISGGKTLRPPKSCWTGSLIVNQSAGARRKYVNEIDGADHKILKTAMMDRLWMCCCPPTCTFNIKQTRYDQTFYIFFYKEYNTKSSLPS